MDIGWHEIESAITEVQLALVWFFIFQGLIHIVMPRRLKKFYLFYLALPDGGFRIVGVCLIVLGLFLMMVVR